MATSTLDMETTDIIICGCGPTGAMLSAQLGLLKVNNICLDKEQGITHDPRGIALDEDGIRALQSIGIYDKIHTEIGQCMGKFNFVGGVHNNLQERPFMLLDYGTSEGGTGHVGFICHKQPVLEKHIRTVMNDLPQCKLREGCTLTSITEDADWVYATYRDQNQMEHTIRGLFLVGSDGKTGFTRKKYLEPKGIVMEQSSAYVM
jgi:2-polyprenyl-6-methoxyphenol hydroxylase-like FAD-dependent oxidoreductase